MFHHNDRQENSVNHTERDGRFYWLSSTSSAGTRYLRCKDAFCPGRANLRRDGTFQITFEHQCRLNPEAVEHYTFREELHERINTVDEYPNATYYQVAERHQNASANFPYASMESTLNRWRQKTRPRKPRNLPDYTSLLSEDEWKRKYLVYKGGELSVTTIAAGASNFVTIYADRTLLSLLQPRQKLNIDATFAVCPSSPKVTQLLTVIGTINDEKVPIIWALMTKKNTQAYQAFFQYFKNHLAPNLQPHTFFVDFEQALTNVIREFYPNARIVHCFFHHIQALTKKLASLKGKKKIHRNMKICPRAKLFLRKIMALALLPFDRIEGAYQNLIADTDLDLRTYFASFLQYYEQYWIQQCRPENYSVYGLSKRTNNDIEAYHRTLWEKLGLKPDIWVFTAQLRSLLVEVKLKIAASNRGHRITRTTEHKYLVRQNILARIWELYEANELNDKKLLIASSHLIRAFGADRIMRTVHEVNNFINTEAYEDIVRLFPTLHRYTVDKQGPLVDGSLTVTRH